jgi:hypothetical protein
MTSRVYPSTAREVVTAGVCRDTEHGVGRLLGWLGHARARACTRGSWATSWAGCIGMLRWGYGAGLSH